MPDKRCTVAVIDPGYWDQHGAFTTPFAFANGVVIEVAPQWFKSKRLFRHVALRPYGEILAKARYVFAKGCVAGDISHAHDAAIRDIERSNLCLWLAKPSMIGFELSITASIRGSGSVAGQIVTGTHFSIAQEGRMGSLTPSDLQEASMFCSNMPWDGCVWNALRALCLALAEKQPIRYALLWFGLEALFGPDEGGEITHKIAERIAFFNGVQLASDAKLKLYHQVKKCYTLRSKIVHGLKLQNQNLLKADDLSNASENMIRESLSRILSDHELVDKFSGADREAYLNGLLFR